MQRCERSDKYCLCNGRKIDPRPIAHGPLRTCQPCPPDYKTSFDSRVFVSMNICIYIYKHTYTSTNTHINISVQICLLCCLDVFVFILFIPYDQYHINFVCLLEC